MKQNESKTNKTLLRVILAAAAVLILCGAAVGAVGAAEPTNLTDSINLIKYGEVTLTDNSTDTNYILGTNSPFKDKATYSFANGMHTLTLKPGAVVDLEHTLEIQVAAVNGAPAFTIDLNGGVIQRKSGLEEGTTFSLIRIGEGKGLKLQDSGTAEHYFTFVKDGSWLRETTVPATGTIVNLAAFDRAAAEAAGEGTYHVKVTGGCITGGIAYYCGGVMVNTNSVFTMSGGNIVGNTANNEGGGVYVTSASKFVLSGGNIVGNTSHNSGSGVYVQGGGGDSVFTMSGGSITGNTATGNYGYGGGVYIHNYSESQMHAEFEMTGGSISGNKVTGTSKGGGVYVMDGATFKVKDSPVISGNMNADGAAYNVYLDGSTTYVQVIDALSGANIGIAAPLAASTKFGTIFDGATSKQISAATACFFPDSGFWKAEASSSDLKWSANEGSQVVTFNGTSYALGADGEIAVFNAAIAEVSANSSYSGTTHTLTLGSNLPVSSSFIVNVPKSGTPFTIDLNGQVLQGNGSASVITVVGGAELVVKDSSPNAPHYFKTVDEENEVLLPTWVLDPTQTEEPKKCIALGDIKSYDGADGGWAYQTNGAYKYHYVSVPGGIITGGSAENGGGVYVTSASKFVLSGGNIVGNTATRNGGGVLVSGGTFTMSGGNIAGNHALSVGGGVYVADDGGTFTLSGGNIIGNTANGQSWSAGGGVDIENSADAFTMSGGSIIGNYASGTDVNDSGGGGVFTKKPFTMSGGSITGNSSDSTSGGSGGVFIKASSGKLNVSGTAVIKDNKKGNETSNVCQTQTQTVLAAPLTGEVHITTPVGEGTEFGTTTLPALPGIGGAEHFIADVAAGADLLVGSIADGKLKWVKGYTVTFDENGHGTAPEDQIVPEGGKVTKPADPTETGWNFEGWHTEAACETAWNFDTDTVSENTTLYAKWTQDIPPTRWTVTFMSDGVVWKEVSVEDEKTVSKPSPAPAKEGYTLAKWLAADGTEYDFTLPVTGDITLTAKWNLKTPADTTEIAKIVDELYENPEMEVTIAVSTGTSTAEVKEFLKAAKEKGVDGQISIDPTADDKDAIIKLINEAGTDYGPVNLETTIDSEEMVTNLIENPDVKRENLSLPVKSDGSNINLVLDLVDGTEINVTAPAELTLDEEVTIGMTGQKPETMEKLLIAATNGESAGKVTLDLEDKKANVKETVSLIGNENIDGDDIQLEGIPNDVKIGTAKTIEPCEVNPKKPADISNIRIYGITSAAALSSISDKVIEDETPIPDLKDASSGFKNLVVFSVFQVIAEPAKDGEAVTLIMTFKPAAQKSVSEAKTYYLKHFNTKTTTWDSTHIEPKTVEVLEDGSVICAYEVTEFSPFALVTETPIKKSSSSQGSSTWAVIPVIPAGSADAREAAAHVVTEDISNQYTGTVFTPVSSAEITRIEAVSPESAALLTAALEAAAADGIPLTNSKGAKAIVNTAEQIPGAQTTAAFTQIFDVESSDGTWVTTVPFKVRLSDLAAKNLTTDDVTLYHYLEDYGIWIPLETGLVSTDDEYAYYEAATDGASPFGVLLKKADAPEVKPVTPSETPAKTPAPFVGILAGLGAAAAAFGLRRK